MTATGITLSVASATAVTFLQLITVIEFYGLSHYLGTRIVEALESQAKAHMLKLESTAE